METRTDGTMADIRDHDPAAAGPRPAGAPSSSRRSREFVNSGLILSIGTFLPKFASFIILPILTGCLTKEEYGTYDLIVVLASLVLPAATLQIQTAAFRFLVAARGDRAQSSRIITNILAVLLPVSAAALAAIYFLFPSQSRTLRLIVCLYFFWDALYGAMGQIARGIGKNLVYSTGAIINSAGNVLFLAVLVLKLDAGLMGAVFTLLASYLAATFYIAARIRIHRYIDPGLIDRASVKEMLAYSWPMVPNAMSMWVMRASDRFVISVFMGVSANAVYAAANKIPSILTLAQNTFALAWTENASVSVNDENVGEYYSSMFRRVFDIMAGFMSFLIGAAPILFAILIRGDYGEALGQIPPLLMAMLFFGLSSFLGGVYVAFMKTRSVGVSTMVAAAINLVTDLSAIRWIGLYAASGSTLISYIVLFVYRSVNVNTFVKLTYDLRHMAAVFAVLIVQIWIYYQDGLPFMAAGFLLGAAAFLLLNRDVLAIAIRKLAKKA